MNTATFTVILAGSSIAAENATPTWQHDYSTAQQQGVAQKKPLAVVFGAGANGWTKVVRETTPAADVTKALLEQYVCVYVDTASPRGQKLAADFGIVGSTGLVISDRNGTAQAFWHQGDLTNASMAHYLQKYADPTQDVRGTETVNSRASFYPPISQSQPRAFTSGSC